MEIATIGFTQSSAERFFERLRRARVRRLVDVRLNNTSQLAGFARAADLPYLLREICGIEYEHNPELAPTQELLTAYREKMIPWEEYERRFRELMTERDVPVSVKKTPFRKKTALLCSEAEAEHCHRRVVAELLAAKWGASVAHL